MQESRGPADPAGEQQCGRRGRAGAVRNSDGGGRRDGERPLLPPVQPDPRAAGAPQITCRRCCLPLRTIPPSGSARIRLQEGRGDRPQVRIAGPRPKRREPGGRPGAARSAAFGAPRSRAETAPEGPLRIAVWRRPARLVPGSNLLSVNLLARQEIHAQEMRARRSTAPRTITRSRRGSGTGTRVPEAGRHLRCRRRAAHAPPGFGRGAERAPRAWCGCARRGAGWA